MPTLKHDTDTDRRSWYAIGVAFVFMGLGLFLWAVQGWVVPGFLCAFAGGAGGIIWFFALMYRYRCPQCGARLRFQPPPTDGAPIKYYCRACDVAWDTGLTRPTFGSSLAAPQPSKPDAPISAGALAEIHEALFQGRKVDAIKRCREVTGARLAEAVHRVERMDDELRAATPEKFIAQPKAPRSILFRVLFVLAVIIIVVIVLAAVGGLMALLLQFVSHSTK